MGGKSGSSDTQTRPWKGQRPFLKELYAGASEAFGTELEYFPGSTIADRGARQEEALSAQFKLGQQGSKIGQQARKFSGDVLEGRYLDPESNPNLNKTFDVAASRVSEAFNRTVMPAQLTAGGKGRNIGSSAQFNRSRFAADQLGTTLSELGASIYGGAYQQERGLMESARAGAPALQAGEYADIAAMRQVGDEDYLLSQRKREDEVKRHEFEQGEFWQRIGLFGGAIGSPMQGNVTTSTRSPFSYFGLRD